jgi:hypothetical protein
MQSFNVDFNSTKEGRHTCVGHREGDWVIFTCPICKDYEKRYNLITGKLITKSDPDNEYIHQGSHAPVKIEPNKYSQN